LITAKKLFCDCTANICSTVVASSDKTAEPSARTHDENINAITKKRLNMRFNILFKKINLFSSKFIFSLSKLATRKAPFPPAAKAQVARFHRAFYFTTNKGAFDRLPPEKNTD
jgi:hypothetical protein